MDVVRVWLVHDDLPQPVLAEFSAILDSEERRRADAIGHAEGRRRYITAHGAARLIIGGHLGAPARELRWELGPNGKPELAGEWTGVRVNLSHSGALSMVAISASRRVGADVQHLVPGLDVVAMANRYYPPEEARFVVAGRTADERAERFAGLWARKEALTKSAGGRLTETLPVAVQGPGETTVVDYSFDGSPERHRITDVPAPAGFRAAVALSGEEAFDVVQQVWTWPLAEVARLP